MKKEVEELIRLFKKLKDITDKEEIEKDELGFYQNINLLLGTYEMIKDQIPEGSSTEIHGSIRKMIQDMIKQLKEELGELNDEPSEFQKKTIEFKDIDELLKKPGLTSAEIDHLLDEKLKQQKIKNIGNE
ncbi:MAG: hypothetical protein ABIJ97_02630 [Bacteroidota bacterium]